MPYYECVFIARQDISASQVENLTGQLTDILQENGGRVAKTESWGLRNLAYRIKKNRKGHYVLMNLDTPAPALHELERRMRLNEDILRFLTIRVDELEEGPSIVLQSRGGRDDRGDRGDRGGRGRGGYGGRGPRSDSTGGAGAATEAKPVEAKESN